MNRVHSRRLLALSACTLVLCACGTRAAGGDASAADTPVQADVQQDLTLADAPIPVDPGPAPDVDAPGHPHPYWTGVTWDGIWPDTGFRNATYHVTLAGTPPTELDLHGTLRESIVIASGGSVPWTRLAIGDLVPDAPTNAMALYFDHGTPWKVKVLGTEIYSPDYSNPTGQWFDTPIQIPLDLPPMGTPVRIDASITVVSPIDGTSQSIPVSLAVQAIQYDAACPSPLPPASNCAEYRVTLSGAFVGGGDTTLVSQVILHPQQRIVSWSNLPGFAKADLTDLWKN